MILCKFSYHLDEDNKFCAFYGGLPYDRLARGGPVYQAIVTVENTDEQANQTVDISFKLSVPQKESDSLKSVFSFVDGILGAFKSEHLASDSLSPQLEFIPIVANISSGDNAAFRHYYKAECK